MAEENPSLEAAFIKEFAGEDNVSIFADELAESEDVTEEVVEEVADEEVEEEDAVETEEDSDYEEEESDEEAEEEGTTDDVDEQVATLEVEKANLNKALHSEREKRKLATTRVQELEQQIQTESSNSYKEQLDKVLEQIKELDLEDVIKVEKPQSLDPRIQALLKQQEAVEANTVRMQRVGEMQTEVAAKLPLFKNIDPTSSQQGEILGRMIMASVAEGSDMEEAVQASLETLSTMLGTTTKVAKKARTPVVKPRVKPVKASTHAKKRTSPMKKSIADGDFKGLFAQMGKDMAGE